MTIVIVDNRRGFAVCATSRFGHIRILPYSGCHFEGQKCIAVIERKV